MDKIMNYIDDKVEEFRINGGKPTYLGLRFDIFIALQQELREARAMLGNPYGRAEFLGLPIMIFPMNQSPTEDGVYIHQKDTISPPLPCIKEVK